MTITFLISEGFRGFARSKFSSLITIFTISIALIILGTGYLIARDVYRTVERVRASFDIEIFLLESASEDEMKTMENFIRTLEQVEEVRFISKEEAARRFKQEFGEDIFDILEVNPLPASFNITLKPKYRTIPSIEALKTTLEAQPITDEVKYRRGFIMLLQKYLNFALIIGGILSFLIIPASIILVSNTIKLSIFAKSQIISILKLLGATNWFIKAPFWIEGALQGFIAACIAITVLFSLIFINNTLLTDIVSYTISFSTNFFIGIIVVGISLGWLGSRRAIRRFIDERK